MAGVNMAGTGAAGDASCSTVAAAAVVVVAVIVAAAAVVVAAAAVSLSLLQWLALLIAVAAVVAAAAVVIVVVTAAAAAVVAAVAIVVGIEDNVWGSGEALTIAVCESEATEAMEGSGEGGRNSGKQEGGGRIGADGKCGR